ncbi:hypothetical protein CYMTET_38232 [Cymbomonas tetramitiformis]|uniref:Band 7 domain-containing protein n=1 Tax=Cymbomonas tetramitiformis TaxID=36881 RepID=A0AAE0CDW5_9CHLO|nr:hypothetical protein CYMTET_38232 [Cymbomonas tetramitiformis]|eukprot:gene14773-17458_t
MFENIISALQTLLVYALALLPSLTLCIIYAVDDAERWAGHAAAFCIGSMCLFLVVKLCHKVLILDKDEYLILSGTSGKSFVRGPGIRFPVFTSYERCKAVTIGSVEYAIVQDDITGTLRQVQGPTLLFLGPYETLKSTSEAYNLSPTQYFIVQNILTSEKRLERGPQVFIPGPYERLIGEKVEAVALKHNEFIKIQDKESGKIWIESGVKLIFLEPTHVLMSKILSAWSLKADEYVKLIDSATGKIRVARGEQLVIPGVTESLVGDQILKATRLKAWEYVLVVNTASGDSKIVKGPTMLFLGPSEMITSTGKQQAVEVDQETAVLVRNKSTGQQRLLTEPQLFIPTVDEEILEVRKLIKLADNESMICTDEKGDFRYFYGSAEKRKRPEAEADRSFFLPPYWAEQPLLWSRGRRREKRDLVIHRFDIRPQYMSFEFACRTADNVELVLEGTFFWEVVSLPDMMRMTGDAPGDICNHARSQFIQLVSKVKLQEFMDDFNGIAARAHNDDQHFYESRGIKIHSLEITKYSCADRSTAAILEQIIQETTNRMNRLSQQESENEVALFKVNGMIEQEKMNADLLTIQHQHSESAAINNGTAEAEMVRSFLAGLEETVPDLQSRIELWNVLRKGDALTTISQGKAHVYFTPKDVNLSIENQGSS